MPPDRLRGRPARSKPSDLLLDGWATLFTEGRAAAAPLLRRATAMFADEASPRQENFRWGWMTTIPPNLLWDGGQLACDQRAPPRDAGALARLPIDLADWGIFCLVVAATSRAAAVAIAEADSDHKGDRDPHCTLCPAVALRAPKAKRDRPAPLIESTIRDAETNGQGLSLPVGRVDERNPLQRAEPLRPRRSPRPNERPRETPQPRVAPWASTELIEAAVRTGRPDVAAGALERVMEATAPSSTDWGLGIASALPGTLERG